MNSSSQLSPDTPGFQVLRARKVTLLAGAAMVTPENTSRENVCVAIASHAELSRLQGLPDDLNPLILDPERVLAFIEGLPQQTENVLHKLENKFVALGSEGLRLSVTSPIEAASIATGYELLLPVKDGLVISAALRTSVRHSFAQAIAAKAKNTLDDVVQEVKRLEESGAFYTELSQAKWRRFAIATVWRLATASLAEVDRRYRSEAKEAAKQASAFVTPPWVELPRFQ